MRCVTAYLDTCVISGLVKEDLKPDQQMAVLKILQKYKAGTVSIVTSRIAKDEIERIPRQYRYKHETIYYLISDITVAPPFTIHGRGPLGLGLGLDLGAGTQVPDPMYKALKELLPDEQDAQHIFQASKSEIQYFITTDEHTILSYNNEIEQICDVKALTPATFYNILINDKMNTPKNA